jgi:hypothetical protein
MRHSGIDVETVFGPADFRGGEKRAEGHLNAVQTRNEANPRA